MKLSGIEMSYTRPMAGIHETVRYWNVIYTTYGRYTWNVHDLWQVYMKLSGIKMSHTTYKTCSRYDWNNTGGLVRAAERYGGAQDKYKKCGPLYRLCEGGLRAHTPGNLHGLKCVLVASAAPFHACIQYIHTCKLPSSLRKVRCMIQVRNQIHMPQNCSPWNRIIAGDSLTDVVSIMLVRSSQQLPF